MTGITVIVVVVALAVVVGFVVTRREGKVRSIRPAEAANDRVEQLLAAGVQRGVPTVLHFSASWCGPCAAVRRVVASVVSDSASVDGPAPVEVEVDMDENPALAREMGVMSLPTTFVLDAHLVERSRVSGVPSARDLVAAIESAR
ncbi:thiol reductase thioredoxin [Rhodococcoides trifolii]|uniref:Thiol reductase thioredoxin n=1 Tax=Rhodococcoides trifolii TaxID=908250 RepID=A0A917G4W3_9NOCA|nr:thioredoxin family protein [Rhodococcus trifolii]GGG23013.1 thiol reductase thioredoxin [Rhodococcus trifolii]